MLPSTHAESVWEIDEQSGQKVPRPKLCREHPGEKCRYVCKDHEKVLCAKCLIAHKVCDFESIGPSLSHDAR